MVDSDWSSEAPYDAPRVPVVVESSAAPLLATVAITNRGPNSAVVRFKQVWASADKNAWGDAYIDPGHTITVSGYAVDVGVHAPDTVETKDGDRMLPNGRLLSTERLDVMSACGTVEHLGVHVIPSRPPPDAPAPTAPEEGIEKPGTPQ